MKNKLFVIIILQYIFRNFFEKLTIKFFTFFHILFLTHVQKLQRNEFVKRFIEYFVNNNKMKNVKITLQFEQYFKSFN